MFNLIQTVLQSNYLQTEENEYVVTPKQLTCSSSQFFWQKTQKVEIDMYYCDHNDTQTKYAILHRETINGVSKCYTSYLEEGCLSQCPDFWYYYDGKSIRMCTTDRSCVSAINKNKQKYQYLQQSDQQCVNSCSQGYYKKADIGLSYYSFVCVNSQNSACSEITLPDQNGNLPKYYDQTVQACVANCSSGYYGASDGYCRQQSQTNSSQDNQEARIYNDAKEKQELKCPKDKFYLEYANEDYTQTQSKYCTQQYKNVFRSSLVKNGICYVKEFTTSCVDQCPDDDRTLQCQPGTEKSDTFFTEEVKQNLIIYGSIAGGALILIIIIIVVAVSVSKSKKNKQSQYQDPISMQRQGQYPNDYYGYPQQGQQNYNRQPQYYQQYPNQYYNQQNYTMQAQQPQQQVKQQKDQEISQESVQQEPQIAIEQQTQKKKKQTQKKRTVYIEDDDN